MNDYDLPILTQVLRTGAGQRQAAIPLPVESLDDALDVRPVDETWMADPLVIGNEPHRIDDHATHASDAPAERGNAAPLQALDPRSVPVKPVDPALLAQRVRDAVLNDLSTRIDTELDARIAQAMHAEVETALAQLQVNLRAHLTDALRDVVQRAVDEEVARLAPSHGPS